MDIGFNINQDFAEDLVELVHDIYKKYVDGDYESREAFDSELYFYKNEFFELNVNVSKSSARVRYEVRVFNEGVTPQGNIVTYYDPERMSTHIDDRHHIEVKLETDIGYLLRTGASLTEGVDGSLFELLLTPQQFQQVTYDL